MMSSSILKQTLAAHIIWLKGELEFLMALAEQSGLSDYPAEVDVRIALVTSRIEHERRLLHRHIVLSRRLCQIDHQLN